jgi:hypothetical protein
VGGRLDGGVALLNGRIYTSYRDASTLGAYDVASDTWSTLADPLGAGEGSLASDGERYLYLLARGQLKRLDPGTGETLPLTAPPVDYVGWGGLRYFEGALYAHVEAPYRYFLRYDIAADSGRHSRRSPITRVGATIDPASRDYVAAGHIDPRTCSGSRSTGTWTVARTRFRDRGGMDGSPARCRDLLRRRSGIGFARLITEAAFFTVDPRR